MADDKKPSEKEKRVFELDVSEMGDMKELILQYFSIIQELLKDQSLELQTIEFDVRSDKIRASGITEADSEEDTDWDLEWI